MKSNYDGHNRWADLAEAYVLDALTDQEAEEFETHLSKCQLCRDWVRELRDVIGLLPQALRPVEPPAHVKESLFARIDQLAGGSQSRLATEPVFARTKRSRWNDLLSKVRLRFVTLGARGLALVIYLVMGVILVRQHNELVRQQAIQGLLTSLDSQSVTVSNGTAHARLTMVPDSPMIYVVVTGLPALPEDRDYQVWLRDDGEPESVGVFHPNGEGQWLLQSRKPMRNYWSIEITEAPSGGSLRPTDRVVLTSVLYGAQSPW